MRDTYSKLNYHLVFSTKNRVPLIAETFRDSLYGYIGGILRAQKGVLLVAGGMPDHVHLLAGWGTTISVAKMLQLIKTNSSKWLNEQPFAPRGGFAWQAGYGAFSVSASQVPEVRQYVLTQEKHHRRRTFRKELMELLNRHGVEYDAADFEAWLE